jgi:hypothetical protein
MGSRRMDSNPRPAVYKAEPPARGAVEFRAAIVEGEVIGCGSASGGLPRTEGRGDPMASGGRRDRDRRTAC